MQTPGVDDPGASEDWYDHEGRIFMSPQQYTPPQIAGQGIAAVHQRPFCANEDSHIVGRFDAETAWATFPKLELQPPHAYAAILLDIDSTEGLDDAPGKSWWGGNPSPAPNWMVVNTRPGTPERRPGGRYMRRVSYLPVTPHKVATLA